MTENTSPETNDTEAEPVDGGHRGEESAQAATGTAAEAEPDDRHVPDKQMGRWKDDGGAVDFTR